jgi:hypothetical protein
MTGIPLGIWGLVLLLHPDVQHAYLLTKNGMARDQVMQHFSAMVPPPTQPPPAQWPPTQPPPEGV